MTERRVVISGMGVLASNGTSLEEFWQSLIQGRSGVDQITCFDASEFAVKIAGEVKNFNPADYVERKIYHKLDRFAQLSVCAAQRALEDAQLLELSESDKRRVGVIIGSSMGGILIHEEQIIKVMLEGGPRKVQPSSIPRGTPNAVSSCIAMAHHFTGPNYTISSACASGANAIGQAAAMVKAGLVDLCVTGGVEAPLTPVTFAAYQALRCLATSNGNPAKASRPFDQDRTGFVMGEGAGILVVEDYEHAKRRGATIYAEVRGFGSNCGAYSMYAPRPDGQDAAAAILQALETADLTPDDIDYINAHGTATKLNDQVETIAIKQALGEAAKQIPISATKSMTAHTIGASGGIEAVVCCLSLQHNMIHPTINLATADPSCDLDYVADGPREVKLNHIVSNSFGFGSNNAVLVLSRV